MQCMNVQTPNRALSLNVWALFRGNILGFVQPFIYNKGFVIFELLSVTQPSYQTFDVGVEL